MQNLTTASRTTPAPKVALYLRLSREDDAHDNESQSIGNQRDFLLDYTGRQNWPVADIYIDDGFTGTNFNRPSFLRLLADIEAGRIDTVITKDLSRLGRNYIETGHYIEVYFPTRRVRYIAVNDGIDTAAADSPANALSPFTSVMNDFYARDISKKVRTALTVKKHRGQFIGASAPYGYQKDPDDRHHLLIDEETAPHVRRMFALYLSGHGLLGIANHLSRQCIPTPAQQKQTGRTGQSFPGVWNEGTVRRILTNPTYAGHMTQNRSTTISYKVHKRVRHQPEAWIVVQNTHEALVSQADFDAVQRRLQQRSYTYTNRADATASHTLSGLVFCADCGAPMTFSKSGETVYLRCKTAKQHASLALCTSHSMREDWVEQAVGAMLRMLTPYIKQTDLLARITAPTVTPASQKQKQTLTQQLHESEGILLHLYKDKVRGFIDESTYTGMQRQLRAEQDSLHAQLAAIACQDEKALYTQDQAALMDQTLRMNPLDRRLLLALVDRIDIHSDKTVAIQFTFADPRWDSNFFCPTERSAPPGAEAKSMIKASDLTRSKCV